MNRFLQKIASWRNVVKSVDYISGKTKKDIGDKLKHVEEFLASGQKNSKVLRRQKELVDRTTTKLRGRAALAGGAVTAAGAYGYHKIRQKQQENTLREYDKLFKQSSVASAAKELVSGVAKSIGRGAKKVTNTAVDISNTATGGKIRDYGLMHGVKPDSFKGKYFNKNKANLKNQIDIVSKKNPGMKREDVQHSLSNLHKQRRDARIAIGATGVAGIALHKAQKAKEEQQKYYG